MLALAVAGALALVLSPAARATAPVASFTYSPTSPLTGQVVTFTSTSTGTITSLAWDLDGDGECDDLVGATAARSFSAPGAYGVSLCVNADAATQKQTVNVLNRAPRAAFAFSPSSPTAGQAITVSSTSVDLDGPIVRYAWDLDGDGAFDDSGAITASVLFGSAGLHRVGLFVVDREGAAGAVYRSIGVTAPPPEPLSPSPVVRLVVKTTQRGVRLVLLGVRAPPGALVRVHCKGRDCPWRRKSTRPRDGRVRFRRLQRRLRAGTVIELFVTKPGSVGKYVRFRIRRKGAPARVDACLAPGADRPSRCAS